MAARTLWRLSNLSRQSRVVASSEDATVRQESPAGEVFPARMVTASSDAQPRPPVPVPVAAPPGHVPSLARIMPDPEPQQQPGMPATVMQEYLQTMERFLHVQQEVMQAFLHGAAAVTSATPKLAELDDPEPRDCTEAESAPQQPEAMSDNQMRLPGVTQRQEEPLPSQTEAAPDVSCSHWPNPPGAAQ